MMTLLKKNTGQFIPISMMIMFTMVIFMMAIVNIYKVTRAKLKVQNLADAAALNLAAQQAQAFNTLADRNEWLNHMIVGADSPSDPNADPNIQNCSVFNDNPGTNGNPGNRTLIPGISCVENNAPLPHDSASWQLIMSRHIFHSQAGALNYAQLVQTVNEAQFLFLAAYNSFLGSSTSGTGSASATNGPANFVSLLKTDMPDLADPAIHMVAWNSADNEPRTQQVAMQQATAGGNLNANMVPMRYKVDHDLNTRWYIGRCLNLLITQVCSHNTDVVGGKMGADLLHAPAVGWLVPDPAMPKISVQRNGAPSSDVGIGVFIAKDVSIPVLGVVQVTARAKAYVVKGSGESGDAGGIPHFRPTYWAKLAN